MQGSRLSSPLATVGLTAAMAAFLLFPATQAWASMAGCGYHTVPPGLPNAGTIQCLGNCPDGQSCLEVFVHEDPESDPTGKECACIPDYPGT